MPENTGARDHRLEGLDGRRRIAVENVQPQVDCGRFPIRRVIGERVRVRADVFADGHEETAAALLVQAPSDGAWRELPMRHLGNDRWEGAFEVEELGVYRYTVEGWLEPFSTWQRDLRKRLAAGQDVSVELMIGAELLKAALPGAPAEAARRLGALARALENPVEPGAAPPEALAPQTAELVRRAAARGAAAPAAGARGARGVPGPVPGGRALAFRYEKELEVRVERPRALFGAWYELFPRSTAGVQGRHGTLADAARLLPDIAELGFQVVYLPPVHPIGRASRKGRNNEARAEAGDPGSPWAIGSAEGGHKAIHPELGSLEDFEAFRRACGDHGLELAMDIAFQCSPDHPYVREHPEWFRWRPDGSVQYAENPPKKYE
ncbi:MAG: DUF3416 domain-containing protein, partial [Spirochaetales bacterium]|nr:DUF3416 domain-containing protein [Spirochaetales bacterium]